jgi:general secretion pathway protein F
MIYPVLLTVVCLGIVGLLLGYVVPEVVRVFEAGDRELPVLTRMLIAASDFLRAWWWLMLLATVAAIWGFRRWVRDPAARLRFDAFKLRLPLVGRITRGNNAARFARTFSILAASAVPPRHSHRGGGRHQHHHAPRRRTRSHAARAPPSRAPSQQLPANAGPPTQAATSGELEEMLERAADNQERELDGVVNTAVGILGPLMILLMGGFVFVIVIALLLPIFELNQLVR